MLPGLAKPWGWLKWPVWAVCLSGDFQTDKGCPIPCAIYPCSPFNPPLTRLSKSLLAYWKRAAQDPVLSPRQDCFTLPLPPPFYRARWLPTSSLSSACSHTLSLVPLSPVDANRVNAARWGHSHHALPILFVSDRHKQEGGGGSHLEGTWKWEVFGSLHLTRSLSHLASDFLPSCCEQQGKLRVKRNGKKWSVQLWWWDATMLTPKALFLKSGGFKSAGVVGSSPIQGSFCSDLSHVLLFLHSGSLLLLTNCACVKHISLHLHSEVIQSLENDTACFFW